MLPDTIDDIFRQKLEGHATPPAPDLWARLALPAADADPVDAAFQAGLRGHAPPPRRELWERLEDEHLRPQPRRRGAAWWHYSAAAVLLLLLLAGGGRLWRGSYQRAASGAVAHGGGSRPAARPLAETQSPAANQLSSAHQTAALAAKAAGAAEKKQEIFAPRATAPPASPSSPPMATTTRPRRPSPAGRVAGSQQSPQQPDAAAGPLATSEGRKTPPGQHPTTPAVAPATSPAEAPALATTTGPSAPAPMPGIIEVDVRRGPETARPVAPAVVAVAEAAPARRRGLRLGGLLRQADHLVHGEPVSLAEASESAGSMTVQARLGGRLLSKTIQL